MGEWMDGFWACFAELKDPRVGNARSHDLQELLLIALCAVLCGDESRVDMADFALEKEDFLREFLPLANGLPSHDTFSRVFRMLKPEASSRCFQGFMGRFAEAAQGVIVIDSKVLRRSFDSASEKSALHMVSALGLRTVPGPRTDCGRREVERDHRSSQAFGNALAAGLHRDGRCAQLSACHCLPDYRAKWRLCAGA